MSSSGNKRRGGEIHQSKLKGHQESVLCLAHSSDAIASSCLCLLSGSQDGTCRLWDLRSSARAALCMVVPDLGQVTSVVFASPTSDNDEKGTSPFARDFVVYASVGKHVYSYDLRKAVSPIQRKITQELDLENEDEVNQLSLSYGHYNNQALHLAAADDGGTVCVTNSLSGTTRRKRVLHHDPDGLAMVTCAEFRPKGLDLASGGTDCMVHLWDVTKPRRPSCSYHITNNDAGANQVCNPPMVHSLSWSPSGRLLAAGLGDGTCSVLRVGGRHKLTEVGRLEEGHDAAVACVVFPEFQPQNEHNRNVARHDRLLTSAGNDGAIFLWDLGTGIAGDGSEDPATLFADEMTPDSLEQEVKGLSLTTSDARILFGIPHQQKPNWLVSSRQAGPPCLFVADTSNDITAYTLPLR